MKEVAFSKSALKTLTRMPSSQAIRIRDKIHQYARNPASLANNVKTLKGGKGVLRLRVGDWRVLMCDDVVLRILDIKARGNIYRR